MKEKLTPAQRILLRRCSGGLRVWEVGHDLDALLVQVATLCQLKLMARDEGRGYETTAAGERWLIEFDE